MRETIFSTALFIHVLAGIASISAGLIAMVVRKKGGKIHNQAGTVFYWSMFFIFITSILFVALYPTVVRYQFFLGIGIVSFYPCYSGDRMLKMKKGIDPKWNDWTALALIFISGIAMIIYGLYLQLFAGSLIVLFYIFGVLSIAQGSGDLFIFNGKREFGKMGWFFGHAAKMIGAYSAAVTAFCVNILPRYMPEGTSMVIMLATWVGPGVIFIFVTKYFVNKYKRKFNMI
ncbi:MAG: hypothetical protein ACI8UX_000579 [Psychromonas sp.]|jgi:hypothetical protein